MEGAGTQDSFYFVFCDVGLKPVHQSVHRLSRVVEHGVIVGIDLFLLALRGQEAVGVVRVPFGVTCNIVDIKATMLASCLILTNVFVVSPSYRMKIETIHHYGIYKKLTTNVGIIGALIRCCCGLVLLGRRNLITFAFVGCRGVFVWQCNFIASALLVASVQV